MLFITTECDNIQAHIISLHSAVTVRSHRYWNTGTLHRNVIYLFMTKLIENTRISVILVGDHSQSGIEMRFTTLILGLDTKSPAVDCVLHCE